MPDLLAMFCSLTGVIGYVQFFCSLHDYSISKPFVNKLRNNFHITHGSTKTNSTKNVGYVV